jgi:hypothetical protein
VLDFRPTYVVPIYTTWVGRLVLVDFLNHMGGPSLPPFCYSCPVGFQYLKEEEKNLYHVCSKTMKIKKGGWGVPLDVFRMFLFIHEFIVP